MARARKSALEIALQDYDGRHHDLLKELLEEFGPTAANLRQAVRLSVHDDVLIAQGASYLAWSWVAGGARMTPKLVAELAELLPRIDGKWTCLHYVRCVPKLAVPTEHLDVFVQFLTRCQQAKLPFLRAWTLDAWQAIADQHPSCADRAQQVMQAAVDDPAPSVRKRLQKLLTGK